MGLPPFKPKTVERVRSKRHAYRTKRVINQPAEPPAADPPELSVDDLRHLDRVAIEWHDTWILCDVHFYYLDGPQVSLRSRDPAHLFGWVDQAELLGRVGRGIRSGVRLFAAEAAAERLSAWAQRLLVGRGGAAGPGGVGAVVSGGGRSRGDG